MSKRDITVVCELAAHLAQRTATFSTMGQSDTVLRSPVSAAADAMRLQRLGRRARRNAAKRWIHPENRDTREEIQPYMDEANRISLEVEAVLAPYGMQRKDIVISRDGVTILALPGDHKAMFGTGYCI